MANKKPIRTVFNDSGVATGLAEFQTGETVGLDHGGTGVPDTLAFTQLFTNSNKRHLKTKLQTWKKKQNLMSAHNCI